MKLARIGRWFLVGLFASTLALRAGAQNTATLTGVIQDPDSQTWNWGTWIATLVSPAGPPPVFANNGQPVPKSYSGNLDASGSPFFCDGISSCTYLPSNNVVARNDKIVPTGTYWKFTICPATSATCQIIARITINVSTFDLGAAVDNSLTVPTFQSMPFSQAYSGDAANEILNPVVGSTYTDTTNLGQDLLSQPQVLDIFGWIPVTNCDGNKCPGIWTPMNDGSGGGGGSIQLTGDVLAGPGTGSLAATVVSLHAPGGSSIVEDTTTPFKGLIYTGAVAFPTNAICHQFNDLNGGLLFLINCDGKVNTSSNILDDGNGNEIIAGNSEITGNSQIDGSQIVNANNDAATFASETKDNNGDIAFGIDARDDEVVTRHNILDDGSGNALLSGQVELPNIPSTAPDSFLGADSTSENNVHSYTTIPLTLNGVPCNIAPTGATCTVPTSDYDFSFTACTVPIGAAAFCGGLAQFTSPCTPGVGVSCTSPSFPAYPDSTYYLECSVDGGASAPANTAFAISFVGIGVGGFNYTIGNTVTALTTTITPTVYCHAHHA